MTDTRVSGNEVVILTVAPRVSETSVQLLVNFLSHTSLILFRKPLIWRYRDTAALRICIDRCIPVLKTVEQTIDVELTPNGEPREMSGRILNRMYHGEIDPETAQKMINAIARKISIDELAELYERLELLERQ